MGFPNLPGVPALSSNTILAGATTLAAPVVNNLLDKLKPAWGIYDSTGKTKVLLPDSFLGLDYSNKTNISTYPIERGAFNSYNKVKSPLSVTVKVSKGGSIKDRDAFLKVVGTLVTSLDLYTLLTPEASYFNMNLEDFDFRRIVSDGVGVINASLHFVEILQAVIILPEDNTSVSPDPVATVPTAQASVDNGMCQAGPTLLTPYSGIM
jgi:hypothetical protein